MDLGASYPINRVVLSWEAAYGRSYTIQTSSNATSWTTIYTENNGNGGIDDLTVSGTGRYVRMNGLTRGTVYGFSLFEFQVFGGTPVTVTPTPVTPTPTPVTVTPTPVTVTPTPVPGGCTVQYVKNQWNTGFTAEVKVINNGSTAINGWTLTWGFANGQLVTSSWNANVTQSGSTVTASQVAGHWNGTIGANGGFVSFGFQANHSGTNNTPTNFALNGQACVIQ